MTDTSKALSLNKPDSHNNLSRQEKIFININRQGYGLEIGPSHRPLAPKSLGYNCKTLDYLDADSLRKKYASNSRIDISKVEEVDYVWQGEPLDQLISEHNCFDYIIASHVIEHLPDLLGFLQQCEVLLKEGGILSLVVPDKRYCFDCFRWPSTTGDVLQAAIEKRTLHTPGVVFDFFSSYCVRDKQLAWFKGCTKQFELFHSFETAIAKMEKSLMQSDYIDVHNWRFTPSSFKLVLADLFTMEKIQLKEVSFYDTVGSEFYVSLQLDKSSNTKMTFDRLCLLKKTMLETLESLNELSN